MKKTLASDWRALLGVTLAGALLLATQPSHAQPDDAARNAARELAAEASRAFEKQDFARAADLYRRAHALVLAPSLSVREARALERLGRLVEASEAYMRTSRYPLTADSPGPFREAVNEANAALVELRPRVPRLTVNLTGSGASATNVTVTLSGKPIPKALWGVPAPVDPGKHELVARSGNGPEVRRSIDLAEGSQSAVTLELTAGEGEAAEPGAGEGTAPETPTTTPDDSNQKTYAWIAGGVGVAGLGVGVVSGLMASSRHSDATQNCPDQRCNATGQSDVDAFRSLRTVSTVGYIVGAVGLGAAATLWFTAPKEQAVGLTLGPGSAALSGRF